MRIWLPLGLPLRLLAQRGRVPSLEAVRASVLELARRAATVSMVEPVAGVIIIEGVRLVRSLASCRDPRPAGWRTRWG